ncbi:MAG: ribose-phosphate diphosphokinase [Candidatus Methanophagaceae archaeon]|nr:MAG: ribose-phosphate diphosphokinase [Methanophagales archaeon]
MKIVAGISARVLAARIATAVGGGCKVAACEFKRFPDGELYTRVADDLKGEEVVVVQSVRTDSDLVCLLQLLDAVGGGEGGGGEEASRIRVVIPYLGYARQDKRFKPGEAVSSRAVARSISAAAGAGVVEEILVVNPHNSGVLRYFDAKTTELDASPLLGGFVAKKEEEEEGEEVEKEEVEEKTRKRSLGEVVVGPDEGAAGLAKVVAAPYGLDYDVLEKRRISGAEVEIKPKELSVAGRNVVIVDDIISTGGTIAEAATLLKAQGANEISVACVHGVFENVPNAVPRMLRAGVKEIVATDTIESEFSRISVARLVAEALKI